MVWKPTNEVLNTFELETKIRHTKPFHNTPDYSVVDAGSNPLLLDKLAQLRHRSVSDSYKPTDDGKNRILKRAKSKYITNALALKLALLHSPLEKYYWHAWRCNDTLLQDGKKLVGHYCNSRICHICNRIRTAKMINGYGRVLQTLDDPQFVTLTIPNVTAGELRKSIRKMQLAFVRIKSKIYEDSRRRDGLILKGIRKIETTYNAVTDTYHPHFHLVINDRDIARRLVSEWLMLFPDADRAGQDIRSADESSIKELFKYVTKIVVKAKGGKGFQPVVIKAIDVIMNAMYGLRTFQPFGGIKRVSEDVAEIDGQEYEFLSENSGYESVVVWTYDNEMHDWIDTLSGELLTGFVPDKELESLVNSMHSG